MADSDSTEAWERFRADVQNLAGELRRQYGAAGGEATNAELDRSLEKLRQAAETVFSSVEAASKDPKVRASTRVAAKSFGSALGETFREVSDELATAFRKAAKPRD
ncbi:MAG: hypothetical protein ACHQ0J_04745 [Candidatus Dormibacterales bacterium]